ncbi:MAG: bifunctional adenosylcobinamide kinase/adenosylcobinamide-phosphate guanylyltransferase [Nitrospirae bacterium]|nr:bifunctional adenosylcobinamide kinase/adenosylcobinamide-phosphate guanylyltransferase [Nitrospirota bacterium]
MKERIEWHKKQRGDAWDTYEEPLRIADVIKSIGVEYKVIILDCLTLWLSNLMYADLKITDSINAFIDVLKNVGTGQALPDKLNTYKFNSSNF